MLAAELHGKVTETIPPHQRMEDVLTSNVLSIFRYTNNLRIPIAFLTVARNLQNQQLDLSGMEKANIAFWPRFTFLNAVGGREADALIVFESEGGRKTAILVEAKYESGLSNVSSDDPDPANEQGGNENESLIRFGHQLADEYCGVKCGRYSLPEMMQTNMEESQERLLLYLTANFEMPKSDIRQTADRIRERKCPEAEQVCSLKTETDIYWLSWRELNNILEKEAINGYPGYSLGECNYFVDLYGILGLRGLHKFKPFEVLEAIGLYSSFFGVSGYFQNIVPVNKYKSFLED